MKLMLIKRDCLGLEIIILVVILLKFICKSRRTLTVIVYVRDVLMHAKTTPEKSPASVDLHSVMKILASAMKSI